MAEVGGREWGCRYGLAPNHDALSGCVHDLTLRLYLRNFFSGSTRLPRSGVPINDRPNPGGDILRGIFRGFESTLCLDVGDSPWALYLLRSGQLSLFGTPPSHLILQDSLSTESCTQLVWEGGLIMIL